MFFSVSGDKNIFMKINEEPYERKDSVEWNINSSWSIPIESKKPRKKYKKKRFMSLELPVLTDYSENLSELLEISKKKDDSVGHKCTLCGTTFTFKGILINHLATVHKRN